MHRYEFKGSVVVYTLLMACAPRTTNMRLLCEAGVLFYFTYLVNGAFYASFVLGILMRDIDMLSERDQVSFNFLGSHSTHSTY